MSSTPVIPRSPRSSPRPGASSSRRGAAPVAGTTGPGARAGRASADGGGRNPLRPADWIDGALELLVDQGIDAVRVDVLARRLGVTRGSFYWHFKDRDDLLSSALTAWRDAATEQVIHRFEKNETDPRALIAELISLPQRGERARRAAHVELAIRAWARRDPLARRALEDVDARRIAYHAQVFSALGFSIAEARARAFILYGHELAESLLRDQGSEAQRAERAALIEKLVLVVLP